MFWNNPSIASGFDTELKIKKSQEILHCKQLEGTWRITLKICAIYMYCFEYPQIDKSCIIPLHVYLRNPFSFCN